ncbi:MAG: hypothetical protein JWP73_644 [Phenylobacterium sp.]|nr:hypothetical protein [Phenylobacterium sp.]
MLRMITLAAAAAALLAAPASAAESIHISIKGKTTAELKAEIVKAAETLCWRETVGSSLQVDTQRACVAHTVKATFAQAPALGLTYAQR